MANNEETGSSTGRMPGEGMTDYINRMADIQYEEKRTLRDQKREQERANAKQKHRADGNAGGSSASGSRVLPLRGSQASTESDGEELTADQLIGMFGPRKEPQSKASKSTVTSEPSSAKPKPKQKESADQYVGFGNEASTQKADSPQETAANKIAASGQSKHPKEQTLSKLTQAGSRKPKESTDMKRSSSGGVGKADSKPPSGKSANAAMTSAAKANTLSETKKTNDTRRDSGAEGSTNANGKRSATMKSSRQDRTIGFDKLPKIQKRASVASPQSPDRAESSDGGIVVGSEERPPRWYDAQPTPKTRNPSESNVSTLLERLAPAISKRQVDIVREILHELPFTPVNRSLLKINRMLDNDQRLSLLFDTNIPGAREWPYDIRADAKEIYNKWCREIFETDLLRGIQLVGKSSKSKREGGDRNQDSLKPGYSGKVDFHAFGNNDLSNGQWFPTQLTTVRDGAHGATQGGISGKAGKGAYSCIMTGQSGYPDEDRGDEVLYCGTDSDNGTVTDRTQLLLDSIESKNPVRFIRKSTLKSQWAPEVGYRYDGLYDVVEYEKLNTTDQPKLARHRFRLVRRPGQDPIRGTGPEKRPTEQEIARYKEDKRFR